MKTKFFLTLVISLCVSLLWAYDVKIDGIYYNYNFKDKTAKVTSDGIGSYRGDISIPDKITIDEDQYIVNEIGDDAFFHCSDVTSISIPNSVAIIGNSAFHTTGISEFTIPNSVTKIGRNAFMYCWKLKSITIPNSVTSIGLYAFSDCSALSSVILPNSLTYIDFWTFGSCSSLESIVIPNSVTEIGLEAFSGCSNLTSVTISNSVNKIGSKVFAGCNNLTNLYCQGEIPPTIDEDTFFHPERITLHVPESSIDVYKNTLGWTDFGEIIKIEDGGLSELTQCAIPTIKYSNGSIILSSETEGAEFVTEIIDSDIKKHYDSMINLSVTYSIKAYATKSGCLDSEIVTATLCWLESDPKTEGINALTRLSTTPVLISSAGSTLSITGADNINHIEFYNLSGSYLGAEPVINGEASFETDENLVIVKIGDKSIKVKK